MKNITETLTDLELCQTVEEKRLVLIDFAKQIIDKCSKRAKISYEYTYVSNEEEPTGQNAIVDVKDISDVINIVDNHVDLLQVKCGELVFNKTIEASEHDSFVRITEYQGGKFKEIADFGDCCVFENNLYHKVVYPDMIEIYIKSGLPVKYWLCSNLVETEIISGVIEPLMVSYGGKWSSLSHGYDNEAQLRKEQCVLDKPCTICGQMVAAHYVEEVKKEIIEKNICFSCNIWTATIRAHNNKSYHESSPIVNGTHYHISPDVTGAGFKGFGGSEFDVRFFDGRRTITHNMWCQGDVPKHFKDQLPDNAKFHDSIRIPLSNKAELSKFSIYNMKFMPLDDGEVEIYLRNKPTGIKFLDAGVEYLTDHNNFFNMHYVELPIASSDALKQVWDYTSEEISKFIETLTEQHESNKKPSKNYLGVEVSGMFESSIPFGAKEHTYRRELLMIEHKPNSPFNHSRKTVFCLYVNPIDDADTKVNLTHSLSQPICQRPDMKLFINEGIVKDMMTHFQSNKQFQIDLLSGKFNSKK